MNRNTKRMAACVMTGALMVTGSAINTYASPVAGVTSSLNVSAVTAQASNETAPAAGASAMLNAGVSLAMTQTLEQSAETAANATAVSENETPVVTSEYTDIAIAQVNSFVNIRSIASEEGEVLGKLYNNSAATVLATEGDWYQIKSGTVTGYVKSEYVVVGNEELARQVGTRLATVHTTTLYVRTEATTESAVLGMVPDGEDLTVLDESVEGWVKVSIEEGDGYVSSDYVSLRTEYVEAESKEEEEARLAKEEQERQAAAAAAEAAAAKKAAASASSAASSAPAASYSAPSGSNGQAVANYASQFVGNPYVYGGTSLTNGADCSGFVMSVYAAFGISLPHSSSGMRSVGYEVGTGDMQPGDIVCYSGHVAIYVGNNTIVHASTASTGIKFTSPANYKNIICVRRIF